MSAALEVESALASEMELARQVQMSMLPNRSCSLGSWTFAFSWEPAAAVGGDYVDLIRLEAGDFYFALGDVSGKGIGASMLMSYLHASLRALVSAGMGLEEIVKNTSLHFCHSSLPAQFATLALGKADQTGKVQLVNAGHPPVLLVNGEDVEVIEATSVPLGLFCRTDFKVIDLHVRPGNSLVVYSDGITESTDATGNEYGLKRLIADLRSYNHLPPPEIVGAISGKVARFIGESPRADDRSILVLARWSLTSKQQNQSRQEESFGGKMNIRERQAEDFPAIGTLLEAAGLPSSGLERTRGWVAEECGQIISHIAMEETGDAVVLRSLATAPAAQGRGIAKRLMDLAEAEAGNRVILLRTRTVGPWVLRRGYSLAGSNQIPASVRATSEFEGSLCSGFPVYVRHPGSESPTVEAQGLMTPAVAELAAISAAMASNCEPCFKFHFDKARKLGVSRADIRKAVNVGLSVKSAPHRKVVETAERFLSGSEAGEEVPNSCCGPAPAKTECGCNE